MLNSAMANALTQIEEKGYRVLLEPLVKALDEKHQKTV